MQPDFYIGTIPIFGRVSLAPMDGISDQPFRFVCRKMGSAITISEFINAQDVPKRLNDFNRRIAFSEYERPYGFQIYGSDAKKIVDAAKILEEYHPDFIDLNLGCSVRRIAGRGAGAGLLRSPKKIRSIIQRLVSDISLPITVKMRLGWDQSDRNFLEIAKICQEEGASLLSVHARRRDQNWYEPADWSAIAAIKNKFSIPVIGNGDIATTDDIVHMMKSTNCDGVMIGRAAVGNPWLFSRIQKDEITKEAIFKILQDHWLLMLAFYSPEEANTRFKKHLKAYLSCHQFSHLYLRGLLSLPNPMAYIYKEIFG